VLDLIILNSLCDCFGCLDLSGYLRPIEWPTVTIGRNTCLARSSVRLSVLYGLLTRQMKGAGKNKITVIILRVRDKVTSVPVVGSNGQTSELRLGLVSGLGSFRRTAAQL